MTALVLGIIRPQEWEETEWYAVPCEACHFGAISAVTVRAGIPPGPRAIGILDIEYAAAFPGESSRASIILVTAVMMEHFDNFISGPRSRTC